MKDLIDGRLNTYQNFLLMSHEETLEMSQEGTKEYFETKHGSKLLKFCNEYITKYKILIEYTDLPTSSFIKNGKYCISVRKNKSIMVMDLDIVREISHIALGHYDRSNDKLYDEFKYLQKVQEFFNIDNNDYEYKKNLLSHVAKGFYNLAANLEINSVILGNELSYKLFIAQNNCDTMRILRDTILKFMTPDQIRNDLKSYNCLQECMRNYIIDVTNDYDIVSRISIHDDIDRYRLNIVPTPSDYGLEDGLSLDEYFDALIASIDTSFVQMTQDSDPCGPNNNESSKTELLSQAELERCHSASDKMLNHRPDNTDITNDDIIDYINDDKTINKIINEEYDSDGCGGNSGSFSITDSKYNKSLQDYIISLKTVDRRKFYKDVIYNYNTRRYGETKILHPAIRQKIVSKSYDNHVYLCDVSASMDIEYIMECIKTIFVTDNYIHADSHNIVFWDSHLVSQGTIKEYISGAKKLVKPSYNTHLSDGISYVKRYYKNILNQYSLFIISDMKDTMNRWVAELKKGEDIRDKTYVIAIPDDSRETQDNISQLKEKNINVFEMKRS